LPKSAVRQSSTRNLYQKEEEDENATFKEYLLQFEVEIG